MLTLDELPARFGRNPRAPEEAASDKPGSEGDAARPNPDGGVPACQARATDRPRLPGVVVVVGTERGVFISRRLAQPASRKQEIFRQSAK